MWRHLRCVTQQVLKNVVNMIGTDVEALDGFARLSYVHVASNLSPPPPPPSQRIYTLTLPCFYYSPSDQATVRSAFDNGVRPATATSQEMLLYVHR